MWRRRSVAAGTKAIERVKGGNAPYYFHLYNSELMRDELGVDLPGLLAADEVARRSVSELIAEQIARGELVDLGNRLEVEGDDGIEIVLKYKDMFTEAA